MTVLLRINTLRRQESMAATPDGTNGCGLLILAASATRWGTTAAAPGKFVRVDLDFSADPGRPRRRAPLFV